ncbi:hypothetical protein ACWCXH_39030 [Kitasatospora sp. NPDC001660]
MAGTVHQHRPAPGGEMGLIDLARLDIYLNDHMAGATAGVQRARHLARATSGSALGGAMGPLAADIAQDRESLRDIMRALGLPVRRYKVCGGWLAEKAGHLKLNGRLVRRSPLSTYLELELMRTAVEGKTAGWQTLRQLSAAHPLLDAEVLDELLQRAAHQQQVLEHWRRRQMSAGFEAH